MINGKYAFVAVVLAAVVLGVALYHISRSAGAVPSCIP